MHCSKSYGLTVMRVCLTVTRGSAQRHGFWLLQIQYGYVMLAGRTECLQLRLLGPEAL